MLRKKLRPPLQISSLRLTEAHGFVHAHFSPKQEFNFILRARSEFACVRLEPDILWPVRPAHPVWEPMVELTRGLVRTGWIAVGPEDRILFGSCDAARAVSVRYTGKRRVHIARRQGRIRHGTSAAGLVDVDLAAMLRRGHANQQNQSEPLHGQFLTHPLADGYTDSDTSPRPSISLVSQTASR